ncbi:hypothetical protein [Nocardia sp. NPDC004722]
MEADARCPARPRGSRRVRFATIVLIGAVAALFPAYTATTAPNEPKALIQGRSTIAAHVTGEKPGTRCQIAGKKVAGPWATVELDGSAILTLGPTHANINELRVLCEDITRGDVSVHTVRSHWITYNGVLAPIRQLGNSN